VATSTPFDRIADRYDETRGGEERGRRTVDDLAPWLVPGSVLEIGVGTGLVALPLQQRGYAVSGVDLSPAMLARALPRIGSRVVCGDALALPVASGSVDNVVFVAALHAIGDTPGALAEGARVLRPGGRLLAAHGVPFRENNDMEEASEPLTAMREARFDTPVAVEEAATAVGLRPVGDRLSAAWNKPGESPNEAADRIEQRAWSFLWDVDDATWESVVAPTVARLRALPDPDRPRPETGRMRLAVFEK
jgi:SAM-dependent methyltransferase